MGVSDDRQASEQGTQDQQAALPRGQQQAKEQHENRPAPAEDPRSRQVRATSPSPDHQGSAEVGCVMDVRSNTTDLESYAALEDDDRDYYANSGHLVPDHRPSQRERHEQRLMTQAGFASV